MGKKKAIGLNVMTVMVLSMVFSLGFADYVYADIQWLPKYQSKLLFSKGRMSSADSPSSAATTNMTQATARRQK